MHCKMDSSNSLEAWISLKFHCCTEASGEGTNVPTASCKAFVLCPQPGENPPPYYLAVKPSDPPPPYARAQPLPEAPPVFSYYTNQPLPQVFASHVPQRVITTTQQDQPGCKHSTPYSTHVP